MCVDFYEPRKGLVQWLSNKLHSNDTWRPIKKLVMISIAAQFMAKHRAEITFSTGVSDLPWGLAGDECSSCDMLSDAVMEKPHERDEG